MGETVAHELQDRPRDYSIPVQPRAMGGGALVQIRSREEPAVEIGLPEFRLRPP